MSGESIRGTEEARSTMDENTTIQDHLNEFSRILQELSNSDVER
jgi:hypothetical protein